MLATSSTQASPLPGTLPCCPPLPSAGSARSTSPGCSHSLVTCDPCRLQTLSCSSSMLPASRKKLSTYWGIGKPLWPSNVQLGQLFGEPSCQPSVDSGPPLGVTEKASSNEAVTGDRTKPWPEGILEPTPPSVSPPAGLRMLQEVLCMTPAPRRHLSEKGPLCPKG